MLYEVARTVNSTIELENVLNTVVNITCTVLMAEGCALNVMDLDGKVLKVAAEYGLIPESCRFRQLLDQPGTSIPQEVWSCVNRMAPYAGPARDDPICPGMKQYGAEKSIMCVPLHFKGGLRGTLSVFNKLPSRTGRHLEFNREDLELLTTMGTMISGSLENALTFQAVGELARHNEALARNLSCLYEISGAMMTTVKKDELLSIITQALTLGPGLAFDRSMILLLDEDEDSLTVAAMGEAGPDDRLAECTSLNDAIRNHPVTISPDRFRTGKIIGVKMTLAEDKGILVRAAREKKAFNINPANGEAPFGHQVTVDFGRLAFAAVPMLAKDKVVGVIAVDRDHSLQAIDDVDISNLTMMANQAGLAIENSQLYEYIESANLQLSQTRERLLEAEKLAALGELAAGMAHEIRNPLVSIGGFTRRLLNSLDESAPQRRYIKVIIDEVTRLEKTLSEVLEFSRGTGGEFEVRDINEMLSDSLYVLRRDFREANIELRQELSPVSPVLVDEGQIKHLFFNLFYNAIQAMNKGGILTVRTFSTQVDDRDFVACEVSDSGTGISPENMSNIFNPFFTTKEVGTGLGLSIVHKIVTRHHGEIDVVNRQGQGATFIVKLPEAAQAGIYLK